MKKSLFFSKAFSLILLVLLVSCQKEITSSPDELNGLVSSRGASQEFGTFDDIVNNCIEEIEFHGTYHFAVRNPKLNPGGRFSAGLHLNAEGTGQGLTTGAKYKWADNWVEQLNFDFDTEVQGHLTTQYWTRFTGTGGAPSFKILFIFTITVNNNGEVTSIKAVAGETQC